MHAALIQPTTASRRWAAASYHVTFLLLSLGTVFLSCMLRVNGDRKVMIPVLEIALPGTCTYQRLLGIDCPGCGLTRSFISLGHGELSEAWRYNPAGLLGF